MIGANTTISTKRFETVSGKESYSENNTLSQVSAWIEPVTDAAIAGQMDENIFLLFNLVVDGVVDLLISDLVIDADGERYVVKGVKPFKGGDVPSHTEAIIVKKREVA